MKRQMLISESTLDALASILVDAGYAVEKPSLDSKAPNVLTLVQQMLLAGEHPLIQYDIVSSKAILDMLTLGGIRARVQLLSQILDEEGYKHIGRHTIGGARQYLWIRSGVDALTAVNVATDRFQENKTHLHMELVYGQ